MDFVKFWDGGEGLAKFWIKVWSKVARGTRVGFPILSFGHRSTDTTKKLLFGSDGAWVYEQVFQFRTEGGIFENFVFFLLKKKRTTSCVFILFLTPLADEKRGACMLWVVPP